MEAGRAIPELFTRMSGTPSASLHRVEPVLDAAGVGDVQPDRVRGASGVANLAGKDLEPLDAPCRERHRGTMRGKGTGEMPAQTARRPGDERGTAVQIEGQSLLHHRVRCVGPADIASRPRRGAG